MSNFVCNNVRDNYVSGGITRVGATGDGVTDDGPALAYWIGRGGFLRIPTGDYLTRQSLPLVTGTTIFGDGWGTTNIIADDSLGNIGDVFSLTNVRGCSIWGLTIDALVTRTAGCAVRIKGGDSTRKLQGYGMSLGGHSIVVDMNKQYNHVIIEDNGSFGDWGSTVGSGERKSMWRNAAAGGHGYWVTGPFGASQVINNVFMSTSSMAVTPAAALRYQGSGDITFKSVQTFGFTNGMKLDPQGVVGEASGSLIQVSDCQFDSTCTAGGANILINPGAGSTGRLFVKFSNLWIAGAISHGLHVTGLASTIESIQIGAAANFFSNGGYGVRVDNGAGVAKVIVPSDAAYVLNALGNSLFT